MTVPSPIVDALRGNRLLIVGRCNGAGTSWIERFRERRAGWDIARAETFLSGIADLCREPAQAVLAFVDGADAQMDKAIGGLRQAAGKRTKIVLCCPPDAEPIARQILQGGDANDYLICPPGDQEVDAALGCAELNAVVAAAPAASMEELERLSGVLAVMGERPMALLEKTAALIRFALGASGASVVVQGAAATDGQPVTRPALSAALQGASGVIGQLIVGDRAGAAYTLADAQKLEHYSRVIGHVLAAASTQRQLGRLAVTDECSGLFNRRYLLERLSDILARSAAERHPVTVLLFDLDDFKGYNDRFGHDAGDEIIRVTGELFRKHCREQDVVARYGGDEFAVVFWDPQGPRAAGSKHPDCALAVLTRVREALSRQQFPRLGPGGQGTLTLSGGLATFPWDGDSADALLKRADEALLSAKRAGKNRIYLIGDAAQAPSPSADSPQTR